jgi:hypothetical protein
MKTGCLLMSQNVSRKSMKKQPKKTKYSKKSKSTPDSIIYMVCAITNDSF